jgi:hypothetical protein
MIHNMISRRVRKCDGRGGYTGIATSEKQPQGYVLGFPESHDRGYKSTNF